MGTAGAVEDRIQAIAASFTDTNSAALAKTSIEAAVLVPRLYEQRNFQPAWFGRDAAREHCQLENSYLPKRKLGV